MKKIDLATVPAEGGGTYPRPFDEPCRAQSCQRLARFAGLTQFGVNVTVIEAGAWSSQRHSPTRVVLFTPEGHENRIGTFFNGSFACDDVSATYRQLKGRGVTFVQEPQKQPWGEFAMFKDPDGNQFVLSSS